MAIQFHPTESLASVATVIRTYPNPHIIEWFIGEDGLKIPTTKIHRELAGHLHDGPGPITYWLYDLTAWAAFRQSNRQLNQVDPTVAQIQSLNVPTIKTLVSADFFTWLLAPTRQAWVQSVLADPEIYQISSQYPETGIKLGSILTDPVFGKWSHRDAGKSYSAFQYLEGVYLIETLHRAGPDGSILFVLPNDEFKYYQVPRLMGDLMTLGLTGRPISFMSFTYGSKPHHRPYSGNNKIIKTVTRETFGL
jgi:hypothetical protein